MNQAIESEQAERPVVKLSARLADSLKRLVSMTPEEQERALGLDGPLNLGDLRKYGQHPTVTGSKKPTC